MMYVHAGMYMYIHNLYKMGIPHVYVLCMNLCIYDYNLYTEKTSLILVAMHI
jgi:hypothetical protein